MLVTFPVYVTQIFSRAGDGPLLGMISNSKSDYEHENRSTFITSTRISRKLTVRQRH